MKRHRKYVVEVDIEKLYRMPKELIFARFRALQKKRQMTMKKTCRGCHAAKTDGHPLYGEPHGCKLRYKTDKKGHPLEECPKPKSWTKLFQCPKKGASK